MCLDVEKWIAVGEGELQDTVLAMNTHIECSCARVCECVHVCVCCVGERERENKERGLDGCGGRRFY